MFKRARLSLAAGSFAEPGSSSITRNAHRDSSANSLREFVVSRYAAGSYNKHALPASDVCELAYWITESGGKGVEDMALAPALATKHGAEHLQLPNSKYAGLKIRLLDLPDEPFQATVLFLYIYIYIWHYLIC